ncbi:type 1 glutamine amidotransferase domain-containing protein [Halobacillus shinanisalinarum]|uniref:Type 1 glutamine amidotransferase domain-containing protein n=1 Tax=Halobacillus shinanisalinarum TaxID=2932258 RepID=A0ABY4GTW7_9BACI|nr:type 1 glutamine amidotransferase domain-containing protein [Halobacillus shinanisalinarum]UOQ91600.1 type 1 glutamine amidotransferase domain-containing protein [Halobacillus shinanisalinarum]
MPKKILMVVTNHGKITKDKPTGIWLSEFGEPFNEFNNHGFDVTVASPKGGKAPVDPGSVSEDEPQEILDTKPHLEDTVAIDTLSADSFDAIFLPGGHGTMFDFPDNQKLQELTRDMYEADKSVAAVCHGPAGLVGVKLTSGERLVKGKQINSFTDAEETDTTLDQYMPFLLESKLRELGANFIKKDNWAKHIEVDGNLITGQNPQSALVVSKELMNQLNEA